MVKRQTVWLSTMMVLSLMLIGYYTMNNDGSLTTSKSTDGSSVVTSTGGSESTSASSNQKQGGTGAQSGGSSSSKGGTSASTGSAPTSGTDWYVNMQTQQEQQLTQQMDSLSAVITNNNSSADAISNAEQELRKLENLKGEVDTARDMVMGKGYKDCVIVPDTQQNKAVVYVKTDNLTNSQAVEILNIVSKELNIPIYNVDVHQKA